ncbi:unnamed protein product [Closterium sp. NIES-53]
MWVKQVRYLAEKGVQGFPKKGYGTYYTTELTQGIATWLQTTQLEHVLSSPFIGILIDESTDRCSGKHKILLITFIHDNKLVTEFMALLTVEKADATSLLGVLLSHLQAVGVDLQRIAGISTDGENVMMGNNSGLTTRLRLRIPHLVSSHCITHRFLPAYLQQSLTTFPLVSVQLDYASVHVQIKRTTSHIESRYVDCGDNFGGGVSELLSPFIARHGPGGNREVKVEGVDSDGRPARFTFMLHEDELEEFEGPGTQDGCVDVCTEVIVHQLLHRLGDLDGMYGARLFTPDE